MYVKLCRVSKKSSSQIRVVVKEGSREARALPIVGTTKRSGFSTNAQSKFTSVVLDGVLGPPRLARHT